jgi:nucleoside-diphosphate-sugar epimerase
MLESSKKIIAVTDALGLMGPAVIRELLASNYKVRALVKTDATIPSEWNLHHDLELRRGDILDPTALHQLLYDAYAAVNTAQVFSLHSSKKSEMRSLHVEGTRQLVNTALECSLNKLIHLSSTEALGHGKQEDGDGPRMSWGEDVKHSLFGRSMFHSELQAWRGQAEGLPTVILRPSYILGGCPIDNPFADWLQQVMQGVSFFPTGSAGWVDAADVAHAVRLALDPMVGNVAWVLSAGNHSYKNVIDQFAEACGSRPPVKPWWNTLTPFLIAWNRISSLWGADASWIGKDSLRLSQWHSTYDGSTAAWELGFTYRSFRDTIKSVAKKLEAEDRLHRSLVLPHQ